jgi:hypothetical protein
MPTTEKDDLGELLRRALTALDAQIAELQAKRVQLAALADQHPTVPAVKTAAAAPEKQRTMSAEARAKISAAAKERWAKKKKAQAKDLKANSTTKKTEAKAKPKSTKAKPEKAAA